MVYIVVLLFLCEPEVTTAITKHLFSQSVLASQFFLSLPNTDKQQQKY